MIENANREELRTTPLNYSVIAGAGAGKTTMLSERISNQIKDGEPIESFVVITYTNVAAEELREKVVNKLTEYRDSKDIKDQDKKNVVAALDNIELLQISTIHSFLFKILKENCFESGLSIDARKLDTEEVEAMIKSFYEKWCNEKYNEIDALKDGWDYEVKSGPNKGKINNRAESLIEDLFKTLAPIREEIYMDKTDYGSQFLIQAKDMYHRTYADLMNLRDDVYEGMALVKKNVIKLVGMLDELKAELEGKESLSDEDYMEAAKMISGIYSFMEEKKFDIYKKSGNKAEKELSEKLTERIPQISSVRDLEYANRYKLWDEIQNGNKLLKYVLKMREEYQAMVDENSTQISNDDILYKTKKLLEENPDILEELRKRYTKIYLDEAQDTNSVQLDIIKMLVSKSNTDIAKLQFKDDNFVVVGDPKQSIYRFSGAEKKEYEELNDIIAAMDPSEAKGIILDYNFRSNVDIVTWVNDRYYDMIRDCGHNPMITEWKVRDNAAIRGVFTYVPETPKSEDEEELKSDEANTDETKTEEAKIEDASDETPLLATDPERVADLVDRLANNPDYMIEEYNHKTKKRNLRTIKYSDFLIITRVGTKVDPYVKELRKKGIAVNAQGTFYLDKDLVLKNFVELVGCVANSKLYKNHVMATQIIEGVDATDMDVKLIEVTREKIRELCRFFRDSKMSPVDIVYYLLNRTDLYLEKDREYTVDEVNSYRARLYQMIENCTAKDVSDLSTLAGHMENYISNKLSRELVLSTDEDAVKIMNVHKSKGLTGNIVIIADRRTEKPKDVNGFKSKGVYYPRLYQDYGFGNGWSRCLFALDDDLYKQAEEEQKAEEKRLEYVGVTRAAHALIIMPLISVKNCYSIPWLEDHGCTDNILDWMKDRVGKGIATHNKEEASANAITTKDLEARLTDLSDMIPELTKNTFVSISPSGFEGKGNSGYSAEHEGYVKEDRPRGNIFGNVMHRTFELIVNGLKVDRDNIFVERIIRRAIMENSDKLSKEDAKSYMRYLLPIANKYMDEIIKPIVDDAEEIYPEYSFSFYVTMDDKNIAAFKKKFEDCINKAKLIIDEDKIWITGQMDLVVKTKDGKYKIYDYKSDGKYGKPDDEYLKALEKKYEGQLRLYTYAATNAFNAKEEDIETVLINLYK